MTKSNIIDVEVALHLRTAWAVLVSTDGDKDGAVWLPISQVDVDESAATVVITLPEWMALDKGLI